ARHRRPERSREALSAAALGRTGAARRDRARHRHRPDAAARRRADRRPRREIGAGGSDAAAAPEPGVQKDDRHGDARPARRRARDAGPAPRKRDARRERGEIMKFIALILKSARRSKRRTLLTVMSVSIAVFLAASLRAVLDGFNAAAEASSSTRIVTLRSTSLFFTMPSSHADIIRGTPGVQDVTWANWFGGVYKDPTNFFAQFAVEPESYLRMYPEILLSPEDRAAFLADRTGCIVGDGLAKRFGFKVGDKITLQVGIPVYGTRDFDFNVSAIYRSGGAAVDNQSMLFHWKYADERSIQQGQIGWFVSQIANPDRAGAIAQAIDGQFANSPSETKTDTEQQFQSTFVAMFGNLSLLIG